MDKNYASKSQEEIWSEKAQKFPVYDEDDMQDMKSVSNVIAIAGSRGVEIADREIIDIGCGTGRHTLMLARKAKSVLGTDISSKMIEILNATAQKYAIANVAALHMDWRSIDINELGWRKKFDVAWAAMTSAINGRGDIEKMNLCAREYCVTVAWGRKRENLLLSEIFKAHGAKFDVPFSALNLSSELDSIGISHTLDFLDNSWTSEGTREEITRDMMWHLGINKIEGDLSKINRIIDAYHKGGGLIKHTTSMEMGILVWRVKAA